MAKYTVGKGIDEYIRSLGNLSRESGHICGKAVYEGAKVVADAVRAEVDRIPLNKGSDYAKIGERRGVSRFEKAGLQEGLGIAKMKNDGGYFNVAVGFHGYTEHPVYDGDYDRTATAVIARSINSGSYFRQKNPFFDRAIRKSKKAAEAAMVQKVDEEINRIMK